MTSPRVDISESPALTAESVVEEIIRFAAQTLDARPSFSIALAGGGTPRLAYARLAERANEVEWSRTIVTFGDERCVPADHELSNFRMATDALLGRVQPQSVLRIEGDDGDEQAAVERFEAALCDSLAGEPIDLVLLGMGNDGHTASLFPNDNAGDTKSLAAAVRAPSSSPVAPRVTLTYDAIARARAVFAIVTGDGKRNTLRSVLEDRQSNLPMARVVRDRDSDVVFFIDRAAKP